MTTSNSAYPPATTTTTTSVSVDNDTNEPLTSLQSQIGLLIAAVLTVLSFIFHKDLGSLTAPLSLIAFTGYGAAIAIARAMKHRTVVVAKTEAAKITSGGQTFAPHEAVAAAFDQVAAQVGDLNSRLAAVEQKPTTAKKTTARRTL